jgi:hypothetical protein
MHRTFTSSDGSRAARARWQKNAALRRHEPVRETRAVLLIVRDSHRPQCVLQLVAQETPRGWSRWLVTQNDKRVGSRSFGRSAIAKLIARLLQ